MHQVSVHSRRRNGASLFLWHKWKELQGTKLCQLLASRSVCEWRVQPCDSDLKERLLSLIVSVFVFFFFCHPHFSFFLSYFFLLSTFFSIRIFLSSFSHPHPSSAIRVLQTPVHDCMLKWKIRVVVQLYCLSKLCFPCFCTWNCITLDMKQTKIKFELTIKLNHIIQCYMWRFRWEMNFTERFQYNYLIPVETWNKINTFAIPNVPVQCMPFYYYSYYCCCYCCY